MDSVELTDNEIINRILNGEKDLYRLLMERYATLVFSMVRRFEKDNVLIEEMAHDVFIKTYERLNSFKGDSAFSSWLYRLTQNHCIDQTRRKKYKNTINYDPADDTLSRIPSGDSDPEDNIRAEEQSVRLWKALNNVNDSYVTPLLMKYRDGMSYEEISEILDVPVGALKVRVHRARKELKKNLE